MKKQVTDQNKIVAKTYLTTKVYVEYTKNPYNLITELILGNYAQLKNKQKT